MDIRISELTGLIYDAFELVKSKVFASSIDWNYLVFGKFFNLTFSIFFFLSFWCEGQIADCFLKFCNSLVNRVLLGTAEVTIKRTDSFCRFINCCDAFCSITVKIFGYLVKCLFCRLIISCEVFSIRICELTHEFEEAWRWITCRWSVSPSSYHTTDEWNSCTVGFWHRSDWSVLDTV